MKFSTNPSAVWQINSTLTVLPVEETFAKGNLTSSSRSPYISQRPGNETLWAQIGQTPHEDQGRKVFRPKSREVLGLNKEQLSVASFCNKSSVP